ncbi:DUF4158 domain-containing protein [Bacillus cereus]|uniref:DUF4158 domain-containing protein n=1 Tax=Bacillus cereus TaxID=1396 RepID=UPI0038FC8C83
MINKQWGAANRLGFSIQIAYLRFPGRLLSANEKVPVFLVYTIAKQLRILPSAIQNSARERDATRREHLSKYQKYIRTSDIYFKRISRVSTLASPYGNENRSRTSVSRSSYYRNEEKTNHSNSHICN